jgi:hypothetical protein
MVWRIQDVGKFTIFNFTRLSESISLEMLHCFKSVLLWHVENKSLAHAVNCFEVFAHFAKSRDAKDGSLDSIRIADVINFIAGWGANRKEYVGCFATFLRRWHKLGCPKIANEVPVFLEELRIGRNPKRGAAVRTLDPHTWPFSNVEMLAIHTALNESFANGKLSLRRFTLAWLVLALGARSIQIALLKVGDLKIAHAKDGSKTYILKVPRAKTRGETHRCEFTDRALIADVGRLVESLILQVHHDAAVHLTNAPGDPSGLPLFPNWNSITLRGFRHHTTAADIRQELVYAIGSLKVISERTGKPLNAPSYRFRRTLGTRAAQKGYGPLEIAHLLDHSTTRSVSVYAAITTEAIERIDEALTSQIAPLVKAFAGQIVRDESFAERGDDPSSRVADPRFGGGQGTCGKYGGCRAAAPIACYTCFKFQPWLDVQAHEGVLRHLVADRERLLALTGSADLAGANDRTILAISEVIQRCQEMEGALK